MELVLIPQGSFLMGSPKDELERDTDERRHQVTLTHPFYMVTCETTRAQYAAVMGNDGGGSLPVTNVSWEDAAAFCRKLSVRTNRSVRLPTEAEWERACRAGAETPFSTGKTIKRDAASFNGKYIYGLGSLTLNEKLPWPTRLLPVKQFKPNAWKLYDMHGNAAEWCSDWYDRYPKGPVEDPPGAGGPGHRVLRGGSWSARPTFCRSANRDKAEPGHKSDRIGFRVVVDVEDQDLKK